MPKGKPKKRKARSRTRLAAATATATGAATTAAGVPIAFFDPEGGPVRARVSSGFAQPGAYDLFLWEAGHNEVVMEQKGNFLNADDDEYDLPLPNAAHDSRHVQAVATVAITPPVLDYDIALTVSQDGAELAENRASGSAAAGGKRAFQRWTLWAVSSAIACGAPTAPNVEVMEGTVTLDAPVTDIAHDAKRNVLYLATPARFEVRVLSLRDLTFSAPISTGPNRVTSVDLSPGGDSLILTLPEARALGFATLDPPRLASSVRLDSFPDFGTGRRPGIVRVLANAHAMVVTTQESIGFDGLVIDYNLAARTVAWRKDAGVNFKVTDETHLARSADRRKLLMGLHTCCPNWVFLYDSDTDTWSPKFDTVDEGSPPLSVNADGSRFLIGSTLFSGNLTLLQEYRPNGYEGGATALSPDAATAFFATSSGAIQVVIATGAVTRTFSTNVRPSALYPLANGAALVALTETTLSVFHVARD